MDCVIFFAVHLLHFRVQVQLILSSADILRGDCELCREGWLLEDYWCLLLFEVVYKKLHLNLAKTEEIKVDLRIKKDALVSRSASVGLT